MASGGLPLFATPLRASFGAAQVGAFDDRAYVLTGLGFDTLSLVAYKSSTHPVVECPCLRASDSFDLRSPPPLLVGATEDPACASPASIVVLPQRQSCTARWQCSRQRFSARVHAVRPIFPTNIIPTKIA